MDQKINSKLGIAIILIFTFTALVFVYLAAGKYDACYFPVTKNGVRRNIPKKVPERAQLSNPASVNCEKNGGKLIIKTDKDGGQAGFCLLKSGEECEEWSYLRGTCPDVKVPVNDQSCKFDSDCEIKNTSSCCGIVPRCLNKDSVVESSENVKKKCRESGFSSICGFEDIKSCKCENSECVGK